MSIKKESNEAVHGKNVYLTPYRPDETQFYKTLVDGIRKQTYAEHSCYRFDEEVSIWGLPDIPSRSSHFDRIAKGDIILFYRTGDGVYSHITQVMATEQNSELANTVWDLSEYDGENTQSWKPNNILFLRKPINVNIDSDLLHEYLGYSTYYPQSFIRVASDRLEVNHENLTSFLDFLQEELYSGEVEEKFDSQVSSLSKSLEDLKEEIESSVLVLGSYDGANERELEDVRDDLRTRGYNAYLAREFPSFPERSLEENIGIYMRLSRFCIMIDRDAAGHLNEYDLAQQQRDILARLVSENGGSTWMMGGAELVDINYIKSFNFERRPEEQLDAAIEWCEEIVQKRKEAYNDEYPWR